MGVNQSYIVNKTGAPVLIVTYNNSDLLYWTYREIRRVPDNSGPISVDGLAGGAAVKVAVIYDRLSNSSRCICDLFKVRHEEIFVIEKMTSGGGVTKWAGAKLLIRGMIITLREDVAESFTSTRYGCDELEDEEIFTSLLT